MDTDFIAVHTYVGDDRNPAPEMPVHSIWQMLSEYAKSQSGKVAIISVDIITGGELVLTYKDLFNAVVQWQKLYRGIVGTKWE